jgi:CheY-like chemotaxis protein
VIYAEPHVPTRDSSSREHSDEQTSLEPKLVLIVDDEQDLLDVTSFVLESEGFRVQTAKNGSEALEILRGGTRPELVLLDMMMPVMNGWEFLEAIARIPAFRTIPVVVLTAAGTTSIPGAAEILRKPFDLGMLVTVVERHASGAE